MVPAGVLPVPACTFQVPSGTAATAPYGLYGYAPLAVPPSMVGSYCAPLLHQPFPAGTYMGVGFMGPTSADYGGSAPYPAYARGVVPGFPAMVTVTYLLVCSQHTRLEVKRSLLLPILFQLFLLRQL